MITGGQQRHPSQSSVATAPCLSAGICIAQGWPSGCRGVGNVGPLVVVWPAWLMLAEMMVVLVVMVVVEEEQEEENGLRHKHSLFARARCRFVLGGRLFHRLGEIGVDGLVCDGFWEVGD